MKGIRRFILFFFIIIIGAPIAMGGAALIKDEPIPSYLVGFDYQNYNRDEDLIHSIESMALSNLVGVKKLYLDEETVNKIIFQEAFGFENFEITVEGTSETVIVKGLWLKFANNEITAYTLINYRGIETTMTLSLGFENIDEGVKIAVKAVKIGELPLPNSIFSYLINTISSYYPEFNPHEMYKMGDINIDELFVTIEDESINSLLKQYLRTDLFVFESIFIENGQVIVEYQFNDSNTLTPVLTSTIDEVKRVLLESDMTQDVANVLDPTNTQEQQFNQNFNAVIDTIIVPKINSEQVMEFTDEQITLLNTLTTDFNSLSDVTRYNVVLAIQNNIDPFVIEQFNTLILSQFNIEGFTSITDLISGVLQIEYQY